MSSDNIIFNDIPSSERIPGAYSEENTSNAVTGLPAGAPRVAIIAQILTAGSGTEGVPVRAFSVQDGIDVGGTGSILHLALRAALKANPRIRADLVPIDDAVGTPATGTIVIANAATATGTLKLWIGNELVELAITNGDAANDIATALDTAINAKEHNMPVTSSVVAPTITLTARNDGTLGNNIPCSYKLSGVTGTTVTITQVGGVVAGATDPSIAAGLTGISPEKYDIIFVANNDATNLGLLKTHLDTYASPQEAKPGVGIFGYTGVQATCETLCGTTINSGRVLCGYLKYSKTTERGHSLDYEIGAALAAVVASHEDDPALPYNNEGLVGIAPSATEQRLTRSQMQSNLENGVTPLKVGVGEEVQIVRAISTYTTNASGTADPALLDITTIRSLDYGRLAIETREQSVFGQSKATSKTQGKVKTEVLDVIGLLADAEIWNPVEPDEVIVEPDNIAAGRFNVDIPAKVVQGLHIIANKLNLIVG